MNADIQGVLDNLNRSWKSFEHRGKRMTKQEVKSVLKYGLEKGYKHTVEFTDEEVDNVLTQIN